MPCVNVESRGRLRRPPTIDTGVREKSRTHGERMLPLDLLPTVNDRLFRTLPHNFCLGGFSLPPSSERSAFSNFPNSCSNLLLSCSHLVKSAAMRVLIWVAVAAVQPPSNKYPSRFNGTKASTLLPRSFIRFFSLSKAVRTSLSTQQLVRDAVEAHSSPLSHSPIPRSITSCRSSPGRIWCSSNQQRMPWPCRASWSRVAKDLSAWL